MLDSSYLNRMTDDELRNYASQMNNIEIKYSLLVHSMNDMIEAYDALCGIQKLVHERYKSLNDAKKVNTAFEHDMHNKYTKGRRNTCCNDEEEVEEEK